MQAPKIDKRSYEKIVAETEEHVQLLTDWQPGTELDAGGALIRIFGRYAEIVANRLNQVPEKSFLSFLNLIGADLTPAQPARVPLTFQLAEGSPVDAFVPAGTQVSAPPAEGEEAEVVFETDRDLLVTRTQLTAVYTRAFDPLHDEDRYGRYTEAAVGLEDKPFPYFAGDSEMEHYLYVACNTLLNLPETTDIAIQMQTDAASFLQSLRISWAYWDGENEIWQPFAEEAVSVTLSGNKTCVYSLAGCPPLKAGVVNGIEGGWLRAQLDLPLPPAREDLPLEAQAAGGNMPEAITSSFMPFMAEDSGDEEYFYLCGEEAFLRRGAVVTLDVTLATNGTGSGAGLQGEFAVQDDEGNLTWQPLAISDSTRAFKRNGQVKIQIPADGRWQVSARHGWTGRWCRFSKAVNYTTRPILESISASYDWELPVIDDIQLLLPADRAPILADTGFANSLTLDLTKDFYPFGEEPRFNDTFYLAYGHIVADVGVAAGDKISLNVALTQAGVAGGSESGAVTLAWEYWNGRGWQPLGKSDESNNLVGTSNYNFRDNTKALTVSESGTVQFELPADVTTNIVNGLENHWLRVRLIAGDYGQAAGYEAYTVNLGGDSNSEITAYRLVEANYAPPIITSLSFDVSAKLQFPLSSCQSYNDFAYADHTEANAQSDGSFTPFVPTADALPTLYLGFERPFDNRSVTLYTQVLPPTPDQVLPHKFQDKNYDDPPQLAWEFARDDGWARLSIYDETNNFAERGLIRFIGPYNFTARELFGQNLYWLRVRWQEGEFPILPFAQRLRLNTIWATQATTHENELLGSGDGNAGQLLQTVQQPVQPGQRLEVREMNLSDAELEQLQADGVASVTQDEAGNIEEVWVLWQAVQDFYMSGPTDRHYTVNRLTGDVQFGDGTHGLIPPVGQNNIRMTSYQTGGGALGNRDAETIVQLKSSIPYVDSVLNHEASSGGAARESLASVKRYGPRTLRHRGRAVTAVDIEDLAFAASTNVARAKAIAPRFRPLDLWLEPDSETPDFTQHEDVTEAGRFGLIIVPRSDSAQPAPGPELLDRVRTRLLTEMESTAGLWVSGPDWMEVTITAVIVPVSLQAADFVGENIISALEQFLHPLTGGYEGKGWKFGRRPYRSDIFSLIESVAGVDHVRNLTITETPEVAELPPGQFLIYSGHHEIQVLLDEL